MANVEFFNGDDIKYTPDSTIRLNGTAGRVWTYWRKTNDGAWLHMGKQFAASTLSRKGIALLFGHDYKK